MKTDKMLHFLASYGITLTAMLFAGYLGAIVGVVAGVGKELEEYDALMLERAEKEVRTERDSLIQEVEWRVRRHQDEVALGIEPTDPLLPLLEYIQNLREVPQQNGFPYEIEWPVLEEVDG